MVVVRVTVIVLEREKERRRGCGIKMKDGGICRTESRVRNRGRVYSATQELYKCFTLAHKHTKYANCTVQHTPSFMTL